LIKEFLSGEKEADGVVDNYQNHKSTLQEQPDMKNADLNQETIRFRHPNIPNVHIEATEMKTPSGQTLMRATTLSRVKEDNEGNVVEATELHREFSVTGEIAGSDDLAWLNEFDEALTSAENHAEGDISVSRQVMRADGQMVKAITVSRQFPEAIESTVVEGGDTSFEDSMADLAEFLGSSITRQFSGGAYGLLRSLSNGVSPRPPGPNSVTGLGSVSPRGETGLNNLFGGMSTGLSRMNSSNSVLPTTLGSGTPFSGLIRSFSGNASTMSESSSSVQPPILVFPQGISNGIADVDHSNGASKQPRAEGDLPASDQPSKKVKLETANSASLFGNVMADDSAEAPSTEQWGQFYKTISK
jgi:hypothetical protein